MYLRPLQKPYPPLWYMRNPVTAAREGMHTIIVGSIDGLAVAVPRYRAAWEEHQGSGAPSLELTQHPERPKDDLYRFAVASAPAVFRVRVWQIPSGGRRPTRAATAAAAC
jgi:hypothetical protein